MIKESVLLVEDDSLLRDMLQIFLEQLGYDVSTAENAQKGLEQFMKKNCKIVITDINMPGKMNGIDVVRRIKAFKPTTRIFVCTGATDNLSTIENVAHQIIRKPFDLGAIEKLLKNETLR